MPQLPKETQKKIIEYLDRGENISLISRELGVARQTIKRYRKRSGYDKNKYVNEKTKKNLKKKIKKLTEEGLNTKQIAIYLGKNQTQIILYLAEINKDKKIFENCLCLCDSCQRETIFVRFADQIPEGWVRFGKYTYKRD